MIWTSELIEQMRSLAGDRQSASQIARVMGVTRNSIIGKCRMNGVQLNGPGPATLRAANVQRAKARAEKIAAELVVAAIPPPPVGGIPLVETGLMHCRFPLWQDVALPDLPVCGARTVAVGAPYCAEHARVCVGRGTRSERSAR